MSDAGNLIPALNELLEAERAGAKVTLQTAREVDVPELKALISAVHRDEAHWCAVLAKALEELDAAPSRNTGAFYAKAMAIADISERLRFLNRGQSWVVRKLQALLPALPDGRLRVELGAMLSSHERNIDLLEARSRA